MKSQLLQQTLRVATTSLQLHLLKSQTLPSFLPLILACLDFQHTMHLFVLMGQAWYTLHMVPYHMLQCLLRSCLTEGSLASGDS